MSPFSIFIIVIPLTRKRLFVAGSPKFGHPTEFVPFHIH